MLLSRPKLWNPLYCNRRAGLAPANIQIERQWGASTQPDGRRATGDPIPFSPVRSPRPRPLCSARECHAQGSASPLASSFSAESRRRISPAASCRLFFQPLHHHDTRHTRRRHRRCWHHFHGDNLSAGESPRWRPPLTRLRVAACAFM